MLLAGLHFNENGGRAQQVTKQGEACDSVTFPKFKKGEHSLQKTLVDATYGEYFDSPACFMVSRVLGTSRYYYIN